MPRNLAIASLLCGSPACQSEPAFPGLAFTTPAAASTEASAEPSPEARQRDHPSRFDLLIYGLSYHTDREAAHSKNLDNEFNPGLGLNYEFRNTAKDVAFFGVGFYKDSGSSWAKLAGPGYQFKLGDRWRLGAGFVFVQSQTYHEGRVLFAPIPLLSYDFGKMKLNAFYAPQYKSYNTLAVFGLYVGIPFN